MNTGKITRLTMGALAALTLSACTGPMLMAGVMAAPTAATVSSVAMASVSAQTMGTTDWYDGLDPIDNKDPEQIRLAKLQDAARDLEVRLGVPLTVTEVQVLAKLYEAGNGDLETFARDRRLTRAQIENAVQALREKGLVSLVDRPGRAGGYEARLAMKVARLGHPLNTGRSDRPPVYAMAEIH